MDSQHLGGLDLTMKRFNMLMYIWRFVGVPFFMKNKSKFYSLYQVFAWICIITFPLFNLLDVFDNLGDGKRIAISLRTATPMCLMLVAQICVRYNQPSFEHLFRLSESFSWEDMPERENGSLTIAGWIPRTQKILKYGIFANLISHAIQVIIRAPNRDLGVNSWYPYDVYTSPAFELTSAFQCIQATLAITSLYAFTGQYVILLQVACSQLDKLRNALSRIQQDKNSPQDFNDMQKKLNNCIKHHQQIIEYLQVLENALTTPVLSSFLFLMATLCAITFSAVMVLNDPVELEQVMHLNVVFTIYLFIICGFGTLLTEKAESIAEAAYSVEWVGTPVSFQRSVLNIVTIANTDFTLTAGKFVPVSRKTMLNILRETWSLFMFLLQVHEPQDHH